GLQWNSYVIKYCICSHFDAKFTKVTDFLNIAIFMPNGID
ncbi:MAG: hypothetical protein RLZZ419_852, partial [Pseudomonadota bacterium]